MTVSVIIPAYNAGEHISLAIDSVLAQSRPAEEIIVIDDGSTDNTAEIVHGYGDKIKYIHQKNAGAAAARNAGIEQASGNWIAFLDADDEWLKDNLKLQIEVLKKNIQLVWVFGNFFNSISKEQKPAHDISRADALLGGNDYFDNFLDCYMEGFYISTDSIILKRSVFDEAGLFQTGQKRGEDTDMWLRIAYRHKQLGYVKQPGSIYHRDVAESLSKTHKDCGIITDMIERHFKLSAEFDMLDEFKICASHMLSVWIRDMLSSENMTEIMKTVNRFDDLLSRRFKAEMRLRAKCWHTAVVCTTLSSVIKKVLKRIKAGAADGKS